MVLFTSIAAPLLKLGSVIYVLGSLALPGQPPRHVRRVYGWIERLHPWSMVEVYLLGTFVAYVKLVDLVQIEIGVGLYALVGTMLLMITTDALLDHGAVLEEMARRGVQDTAPRPASDASGLLACEACGLVSEPIAHGARCPRCGSALHRRKPNSITRTWALLLAAIVLYLPANMYPVLTVIQAGSGQPSTPRACLWITSSAASADSGEPGVELRLRVRSLRQRPAVEVPDGDGRVHQERLGDRRRRAHPLAAQVLSRLVSDRGAPAFLRSDNGPEFVSRALLGWITQAGIETALIDPGKPWQNGVCESFNGKFRDECLSLEWFRSRAEAKAVIETWRRHYNDVRPHSSLGYLTPAAFAAGAARPASRQATGRDAAVSAASASRPVASTPRRGHQQEGALLLS